MHDWKNLADAILGSVGIAVIANIIPISIGCLTIVWALYRIYDIRLSIKIKKEQLKSLEQ